MTSDNISHRSLSQAIWRGFQRRCPNCGKGRMFGKFLKVKAECEECGQPMDGHRADDLPPYITITIVGHIIIALILSVENSSNWPIWLHMAVWPTLTVISTLLLIERVKGATIGYQWALKMHGFDTSDNKQD